ncbi:hypothetical protein LXT12_17060 [Pelomonas sp. P7]|uniref:Uncharacterized protein n=1 Tax=Pelomonas caseinilytica TaxID=2906763 RepID=A0ABS8XK42_9BURK|nr:hypothetical protein [Pelomonas sp. P7]MCE4538963.1 hypothetical protein [Pelomonas sp. P7]
MSIIKPSSRGRAAVPGAVNLPEGVLAYKVPNVVVGVAKHKAVAYGPLVVVDAGQQGLTMTDVAEARVARELSPLISASIDRSIQALDEADAFVQNSNRTVDSLLARLRASVA